MGLFEGLDADTYDRNYGDGQLLRRILRYFRPFVRIMSLVTLLTLLNSLVDTALPIVLSRGIDTLALAKTQSTAWVLVSAIVAFGILSWLFNFGRQWCTAGVVGDVVLQVRRDAFAAVLARDMSFYDEFPTGKIVSRVTSDTDAFATVVTLTFQVLSQLLVIVLIAVVLLRINLKLALLTLLLVPAIFVCALAFRRLARAITQRSQRALARVNSTVQEAVSGIAVAKNFRQEGALYENFRAVNRQLYAVNLRAGFVYNSIFPILNMLAGLGTVVVVYFGGGSVLDGSVSAGSWFLFVQAIVIFWVPLTSIASFWSLFQQGLAASERIFALIDAQPRVVQNASQPVGELAGRIEFRQLDFHYVAGEPVLRDFSLAIQPGETIAVVGHTGAGKSTLGKLVARFYEFQAGELLIDGRDIRSFDLHAYRRQLGVVPQAPFLFSGTVAENIRYSRQNASDAEVEAVARQVGGGDWLDALPDGLRTVVGEQGRTLSMGQRQLVALARLLLQAPSIVVLDEATASVDPLTEAQIQEGLDLVLAGRTAIVIAHRLSTIRYADRIIVLRQGAIVEEGSHEALMQRGGHYADLYNTYFRHQSPDYRPGTGFVPIRLPIGF